MKQLKLFFAFNVDEDCLAGKPTDPRYGVIERDGRRIYRFRSDEDEYRIYFTIEQNADGDPVVVVQRVLHADSLKDFLFRSGMEMCRCHLFRNCIVQFRRRNPDRQKSFFLHMFRERSHLSQEMLKSLYQRLFP